MSDHTQKWILHQIRCFRNNTCSAPVLPFSEILVPESWLFHGRHVKSVDGTTVSMPDTPANQKEYPQQKAQKPGVGFPIARLVVIFCVGSGAVLGMAIGPYKGKRTGENALFRTLSRIMHGSVGWVEQTLSSVGRRSLSAIPSENTLNSQHCPVCEGPPTTYATLAHPT